MNYFEQNKPLITVYVTNHNYGHFIKQCIDSILSQTLQDFRLIIIDDGSTDNSREIIDEYKNRDNIDIIYQENMGLNISNNIALQLATGKYIMRVDGDDYLDPNALLLLSNNAEQKGSDMVFPDYYLVNELGDLIKLVRRHDFQKDVTLFDQPAHGACTLIRKECLDELQGYASEFSCQDGYELWLRFINKYKVSNINTPLFFYRQHDHNLTNKEERILSVRHEIIKKQIKDQEVVNGNHICIIPIRGMEPNRPFALEQFGNKTLVENSIEKILKSNNIKRVIISTPDNRIADFLKKKNYPLIIDKRPLKLAHYNTHIEETISYLLKKYQEKIGAWDSLTIGLIEYPLLKAIYFDTIINTLYLFDVDSCISVIDDHNIFYQHKGAGLVSLSKADRSLRLERESIFRETGGIKSVRRKFYDKSKKLIGGKIGHIMVDEKSSISVQTKVGWDYCTNYFGLSKSNGS